MTRPKFSNPKPPEGISSGHEHPLADIAKSSAIVLSLVAGLFFVAYVVVRLAVPYIPFAWERAMVSAVPLFAGETEAGEQATTDYLQGLSRRLSAAMGLAPDMEVTIHFSGGETVNAYATLGGHIVVFEGLWRLLESENEAAMLLAHEIAHVKNRDPIRGAGSALLASLVAGIVLRDVGILGGFVGAGNLLTALHFSREQEEQADADAARALVQIYGHLNGATDLFVRLRPAANTGRKPPVFLATHPDLPARMARLKRDAERNGWPLAGAVTPLPQGAD
jgi:Zn-dependent protease with chaperone function